ncbi:MAG: hypothetical protein JXR97_01410, partial [Planctomycetes bacterium]|nr:hypothetical protein [Planctomycetota bacterium]
MSEWGWKPKDAESTRLLYEPGNWGDILKAGWVDIATAYIAKNAGPFRYLDLFAGARTYPVTKKTADRY